MNPAPSPLPPFHDSLDASFFEVWRLLQEGPRLRRNAFHMPALATVDAHGQSQVRTVVLREADPATGRLRFHCDRRSAKAAEIEASGRAALHGYDTATKIQIRVAGSARLHTDDALAEAAWAGSRIMSRTCYGIAPAPGTALPTGGAYTQPEDGADLDLSRANFCAVVVTAERLDFLFLDRRGHRRAGWARGEAGCGEAGWTGTWLAP
ncbi:pyridoxamine 5'-phosphate oxidase family protein [Methylobacterium sp. J-090]|uniref:pyridoxamine 5'-phosphate oxidase family protein n=1 Tax=Methylobacterium sp. J-090 TaxID=2836666 RepID=UPI001FBBB9F6|nr:pyridoxamine 5'-phosphate oxidase family protein [Methylobacterium sp. J-090]MCJ2079771.1 pyridoxamine 5'-phosphate oxidase family protein [Methylobacterium sp. J-090]